MCRFGTILVPLKEHYTSVGAIPEEIQGKRIEKVCRVRPLWSLYIGTFHYIITSILIPLKEHYTSVCVYLEHECHEVPQFVHGFALV